MNKRRLNKILGDHNLWVESKGERGKQAVLAGADLCSIELQGANLQGANLSDTRLIDANLSGANLSGACLEGANLEGADLSGTVLEAADLDCANLKGAKFTTELGCVDRFNICDVTKEQLPWLALHPRFSEFCSTLRVV